MNAEVTKQYDHKNNLLNLDFNGLDDADTLDDLLDDMELDATLLSSIRENFDQNREFYVQPRHIKILASGRKYLTEEEK